MNKPDYRMGSRRKSDEWLHMLVDTMNEGLAVHDGHGRIVYVNICLCDMLEYTEAELQGMDGEDVNVEGSVTDLI